MLGWEFPPHISGGLGTACYGMTKGLDEIGVDVSFVLPTAIPVDPSSHVQFRTPQDLPAGQVEWIERVEETFEHVKLHQVPAVLQPYATPEGHEEALTELRKRSREVTKTKSVPGSSAKARRKVPAPALPKGSFVPGAGANYGGDLMGQVQRYARLAMELAAEANFDVIHAHDWMTYPGGIAAKAASQKPLVVHVHSTEFDRSGKNINQHVYDIERMGMHAADCVVCVSYLTANIVKSRYGVPADKVEVVYNAVDLPNAHAAMAPISHNEKIVLFLGRVTMQKGPEYFLQAA